MFGSEVEIQAEEKRKRAYLMAHMEPEIFDVIMTCNLESSWGTLRKGQARVNKLLLFPPISEILK